MIIINLTSCSKCQIKSCTKLFNILEKIKMAGEIKEDYHRIDIASWHHFVAENDQVLNFSVFFNKDQDKTKG